jgi:hypothetical protein
MRRFEQLLRDCAVRVESGQRRFDRDDLLARLA